MNKMRRKPGTATYRDIMDAPAGLTAEIIYGALHTHPRPARRHSKAGSRLGARLNVPFDIGDGGPGGWTILDEIEVRFGADILVPDIAGWRNERFAEAGDENWIDVVPDWVCEIHSPSTRKRDITDKREIYGQFDVRHLWFVDPDTRTLEAFLNDGGDWRLIAALRDDDPVCIAPFDAISFRLDELWA